MNCFVTFKLLYICVGLQRYAEADWLFKPALAIDRQTT